MTTENGEKQAVPQDQAYQMLEARIVALENQLEKMPDKVLALIDANADILFERGAYLTSVKVGKTVWRIVKAPFVMFKEAFVAETQKKVQTAKA